MIKPSARHSVHNTKTKTQLALTRTNKSTQAEQPHRNLGINGMASKPRFIGGLLILLTLICTTPVNAYELEGVRWPKPTTTFYVDIPGANGLWNTSFETAMYCWGVDTIFEYLIVRGEYEDPCDPIENRNGVGFESTYCGEAWGSTTLAMTHSYFIGSTLQQTDIVFNSNESWNVYSTSWWSGGWYGINDFQRIAVHELGHALGLDHEDSGVPTIMKTYASNITIPQQDDINGVAAIYATQPRYRLYNPNNGHHHYTTNSNEYSVLGSLGWAQEGISCYLYNDVHEIDGEQTVPYYRLYNPNSGEHHWTTNANEYQVLGTIGWRQEGVDGHVFASQVTGSQPLYRLYNPNAGLHHWTMDANERSVIIGYGWKDEGIACYVFP